MLVVNQKIAYVVGLILILFGGAWFFVYFHRETMFRGIGLLSISIGAGIIAMRHKWSKSPLEYLR